jgi:hypothetical protein
VPMMNQAVENIPLSSLPDEQGHFGPYGGRFIAETLMEPVEELRQAYERMRVDPEFLAEFDRDLADYVGRPSPLYHAERWSRKLGGAQIYLKREDLNHTGAHKINNTVGQALLARHMGKIASSPRRAPGNTVSPRRLWRPGSGWSVWSIWAPRTFSGRPSMSIVCGFWVRTWLP